MLTDTFLSNYVMAASTEHEMKDWIEAFKVSAVQPHAQAGLDGLTYPKAGREASAFNGWTANSVLWPTITHQLPY